MLLLNDLPMSNKLKISIITVSFNSEETIKHTIESVLSQTYTNIEYIIIDAASTDNTVSIIKSYADKISYFISEKDQGIYYGMNKGLHVANGDIVGILNSDDRYSNINVISDVVRSFESNSCDTVFGDLVYVDQFSNKIIRYWKSGNFNYNSIRKGWMLPHPTFFVRKDIYNKYGFYSEDLKIASDYEMMIRLLYKNKCSSYYIKKILVEMRNGGFSNQSYLNRLKANSEDVLAWKLNGLNPPLFLRIFKPLRKLTQFFKRPTL